MTKARTTDRILAGHVIRLLGAQGPTTVPDICDHLRKRHRLDLSSIQLGSLVSHNRYLRGRVGRHTRGYYTGRETTDTYYYLVDR